MLNTYEHDRSKNLSAYENDCLIRKIDYDGLVLAIGVAQVYMSEKPIHKTWTKLKTGVLCFVKDRTRRSYYFRLFDLNCSLLWQHEMYLPFSYKKYTDFFYYFPGEDSNIGFNYAHKEEANKFYETITKTLDLKKKRKTIKRPLKPGKKSDYTIENETTTHKDKNKAKGLTKLDISGPSDFQIVQTVRRDENTKNFQVDLKEDNEKASEVRKILTDLKLPFNRRTQKFAKRFINNNGGIENFKNQMLNVPHRYNDEALYEDLSNMTENRNSLNGSDCTTTALYSFPISKMKNDTPHSPNSNTSFQLPNNSATFTNLQSHSQNVSVIEQLKQEINIRKSYLDNINEENDSQDSEWED